MKSSAHKALASLQHKYRALIRKHGVLKNQYAAITSVTGRGASLVPAIASFVSDYNGVEKRAGSIFDEQLLKDNITELEATIERLEFDLRTSRLENTLLGNGTAYREDTYRAEKLARLAQNDAQQARSERDDAKQAVWVYSMLSLAVGVLGTYGTLFAYGLVPGIY